MIELALDPRLAKKPRDRLVVVRLIERIDLIATSLPTRRLAPGDLAHATAPDLLASS
jgi:hypothetical protein